MLTQLGGLLPLLTLVAAQTNSSIQTITSDDVAFLSYNVTAHGDAPFQIWDLSFESILGPNPTLTLLLDESQPYFHEAGVWFSDSPPTIYAVSNQFNTTSPSPATNDKQIVISRIEQDNTTGEWNLTVINPTPRVPLPNGGFPYKQGVLFTAQGDLDTPGSLIYMDATLSNGTYPTNVIIDNFLGRQFNSPNDVHVARNGDIFFTDPVIGYPQGIRPPPRLPGHVYVFTPGTTRIRVVEEGIPIPNGVVLSPDEKTAYVTTTPLNGSDFEAPRTIYAFDVVSDSSCGAPNFVNKRIFAYVNVGAADGIKTDDKGNVYAGCGDGVNVWNPAGVLIGKILFNDVIANFAFGPNGQLLVFAEKQLYLAQLSKDLQPAVRPVIETE